MIDTILELILSEARARKGDHPIFNILNVRHELDRKILDIVQQLKHEEWRQRHYENETRNHSGS